MAKIISIGNGFIQVGESLINLAGYKAINKANLGIGEDPEGNAAFGITLTPITPSPENIDNGVDGTFFITTYTFEEADEYESDFQTIIEVLKK